MFDSENILKNTKKDVGIEAHDKKSQLNDNIKLNFYKELGEWRSAGYNTQRLENALENGNDFKTIKNVFHSYILDIQLLKKYEKKLNKLNHVGFSRDIDKIKNKLKNPELLPKIKNDLIELREKIKNRPKAMDISNDSMDDIRNKIREEIKRKELAKIRKEELEKINRAKENKNASLKLAQSIKTHVCPKCDKLIVITSENRPCRVKCLNCRKEFLLKKPSLTRNYIPKSIGILENGIKQKNKNLKNNGNKITKPINTLPKNNTNDNKNKIQELLNFEKVEPKIVEFQVIKPIQKENEYDFKICDNCLAKNNNSAKICIDCKEFLDN